VTRNQTLHYECNPESAVPRTLRKAGDVGEE